MKLVEIENVYKSYYTNKRKITALSGISLNIEQGEIVALMGRTGAGKSTLLNIIAGLIKVDSGSVISCGYNLKGLNMSQLLQYRRQHIGIISQDYALLEDETVFDNVALPLKLRHYSKKVMIKKTESILDRFGLLDKSDVIAGCLSGGQRQRTTIARALCYNPRLILADEPTAALDEESEEEMIKLLLNENKKGTTMIIVTHNPAIAEQCSRIFHIKNDM